MKIVYTPYQNGVNEHETKTIMEAMWRVLFHVHIPIFCV